MSRAATIHESKAIVTQGFADDIGGAVVAPSQSWGVPADRVLYYSSLEARAARVSDHKPFRSSQFSASWNLEDPMPLKQTLDGIKAELLMMGFTIPAEVDESFDNLWQYFFPQGGVATNSNFFNDLKLKKDSTASDGENGFRRSLQNISQKYQMIRQIFPCFSKACYLLCRSLCIHI